MTVDNTITHLNHTLLDLPAALQLPISRQFTPATLIWLTTKEFPTAADHWVLFLWGMQTHGIIKVDIQDRGEETEYCRVALGPRVLPDHHLFHKFLPPSLKSKGYMTCHMFFLGCLRLLHFNANAAQNAVPNFNTLPPDIDRHRLAVKIELEIRSASKALLQACKTAPETALKALQHIGARLLAFPELRPVQRKQSISMLGHSLMQLETITQMNSDSTSLDYHTCLLAYQDFLKAEQSWYREISNNSW